MRPQVFGPVMIGLAATLWATDTLFRLPAVNALSPIFIVFIEHVVNTAFLLPWILLRERKKVFRLGPMEWFSASIIGIGGSALATVFFTTAFRYVNPSVAILLQKLQPMIAVVLAFLFLGERPRSGFTGWACLALGAGVVLSFPNLRFGFLHGGVDLHSKGVGYALAAAAIWALSTVCGKVFIRTASPTIVTFWRFLFGLITLTTLLAVSSGPIPWRALHDPKIFIALLYMGLVPGLCAMIAYYVGLKRTPAIIATFVELVFPVSAVLLNTFVLKAPLQWTQVAAGLVLLSAVTMISLRRGRTT